ncbi:MAG TPA: hypothetical protein VK874_09895 [Gaiellaceae bacterium]|nr:hypothetical protein [Gaiellaceae bacterium]
MVGYDLYAATAPEPGASSGSVTTPSSSTDGWTTEPSGGPIVGGEGDVERG